VIRAPPLQGNLRLPRDLHNCRPCSSARSAFQTFAYVSLYSLAPRCTCLPPRCAYLPLGVCACLSMYELGSRRRCLPIIARSALLLLHVHVISLNLLLTERPNPASCELAHGFAIMSAAVRGLPVCRFAKLLACCCVELPVVACAWKTSHQGCIQHVPKRIGLAMSMRCVVVSWWVETEKEARDSHAKRTPKKSYCGLNRRWAGAGGGRWVAAQGKGYLHSCNWTMALPRDLNP
jgi:hypothetical protein